MDRRFCLLLMVCLVASAAAFAPAPVYRERPSPKEITNSIGMRLVHIPAGEFMMGAMEDDQDASDDEIPRHKVKITKAFYLGIHEVTQKQFRAVIGYNPSHFSRDGEGKKGGDYPDFCKPGGWKFRLDAKDNPEAFPVENVSWEEAKEFCAKLSAMPKEKKARRLYRLPTEAEWEYSCRAGASSNKKFHFGNILTSKQANFIDSKLMRTCEVGSYAPNAFGLYDMHGNVFEWCSDRYDKDYYDQSDHEDPPGPTGGFEGVIRGGSWKDTRMYCRSAQRLASSLTNQFYFIGFRVALAQSFTE